MPSTPIATTSSTPSATTSRPAHRDERLRRLGVACVASGVVGSLLGVVTLAYPSAVPDAQWSYPFPVGVAWVVSVALAVTHALTLAGFLGVLAADPHRRSRPATIGLWIAVVGFAVLVVCELLSGAIASKADTSSAANSVSAGFGVASLLTAVGSVVAGVVIVRSGVWRGIGRWMVLASGIVMIVLVTPANITGSLVPRMLALTLWSLTFIPLGLAVRSNVPRSNVPRSR